MKTLKITTHWTTEEADCIVQLLDEFKSLIWQHYGEDMVDMHKSIRVQQQRIEDRDESDDDVVF